MPNKFYDFYKTETDDGVDYFFCTENGRIYTVTFDMNLYDGMVDNFPLLLQLGYGFLFKYDQSIPKGNGKRYDDQYVKVTITEIISDFLTSNKGFFIVYECPGYKQEKLFSAWSNEDMYPSIIEYGVQVVIPGISVDYFGFATLKNNPKLTEVISEVESFFFNL